MTTATVDQPVQDERRLRDRTLDAVRQVSHLTHEARLLKTMAADAVEEGLHAARRTVRRGLHEVEELSEEAAHRIRREPMKAVGVAFGAGVLLGAIVGWVGHRPARIAKGEKPCA